MQVDHGWMQSREVAKLLGIKTDTLKRWRMQQKGPRGWSRVSPTVVMYPTREVIRFSEEWKSKGNLTN